MKVVYIAGKFTGANTWEIENNVRAAETMALQVAKLGAMPLCPHTNTRFFHGTCTHEFWYAGTLELMVRCDAIMLVPGWEESNGVKMELVEAEARKMPVFDSLAALSDWVKSCAKREEEGEASFLRIFNYVINGTKRIMEADIRRTVGSIMEEILLETGNVGPPSSWEVRSESGVLFEHGVLFGMVDIPRRIFFIQPKAGALG